MKKFLLSILLVIASTVPTLAEDVVLYFSPETSPTQIMPPTTSSNVNWSVKINGFQWNLSNFWHSSSSLDAVVCGRECKANTPQRLATISTPLPIDKKISEVTISIDEISNLNDVYSIELNTTGEISNIVIDHVILEYDKLKKGDITFPIANPQNNLYYEIRVTTYPTSKTGFLQISKVVYKELVETVTPTLSWSADNATAVIGDESFVKPELTCTTDDGSDVSDMIIYSSSDPTVASIDDKGELTILAEGSTTITAAIEETDKIVGASASYILTVEEPDRPGDIVIRFNTETMPTPVDSYDRSWKAATGDYEFTVSNFSNGAGDWNYICCGGAESDTPPSVTTDFCIPDHLSQIIVSVDHIASDKGTITLLAYGETNLNHPVESISRELTAGKIAFDVTPQPGLKYRISVDGYDLDPEGAVRISKIVYRKASDIIDAESATMLVSEPYNHSRFFEVNTNTHTSSNSWLAFKFIVPDGHTLWHRFVKGSEIIAPGYDYVTVNASALSSADESDISDSNADTDRHGFNLYADAPFSHVDNGSLEFYTESAEGVRSNIRSVQFTGVTSINDIPADENDVPAEYYNLQGIRIDTPITPGVYIIRRGSSAIKAVLR